MRVKRLVAFNGGSFCSARYTHRLLEHFCVSCLMGGIWKTIRRGREKKDRFIVNPCDCEILGWIYPVCDCVITWQYQSSGLCLKPPRVLCCNAHTHTADKVGASNLFLALTKTAFWWRIQFWAEKCVKLGQILFVFLFVVISLDLVLNEKYNCQFHTWCI